jgi:antitoxin component HigA of HigAB toxin-antitoxin module
MKVYNHAIKTIKDESDYNEALNRVDALMKLHLDFNSELNNEL